MRIACLVTACAFLSSATVAEDASSNGYRRRKTELETKDAIERNEFTTTFPDPVLVPRKVRSRLEVQPRAYRKSQKQPAPTLATYYQGHPGRHKHPRSKRQPRQLRSRQQRIGRAYDLHENHLEEIASALPADEMEDGAIHIEPVVRVVRRKSIMDSFLDLLRRMFNPPKNQLGPLVGPVYFPGVGDKVYVRLLEPIESDSNRIVLRLMTREPAQDIQEYSVQQDESVLPTVTVQNSDKQFNQQAFVPVSSLTDVASRRLVQTTPKSTQDVHFTSQDLLGQASNTIPRTGTRNQMESHAQKSPIRDTKNISRSIRGRAKYKGLDELNSYLITRYVAEKRRLPGPGKVPVTRFGPFRGQGRRPRLKKGNQAVAQTSTQDQVVNQNVPQNSGREKNISRDKKEPNSQENEEIVVLETRHGVEALNEVKKHQEMKNQQSQHPDGTNDSLEKEFATVEYHFSPQFSYYPSTYSSDTNPRNSEPVRNTSDVRDGAFGNSDNYYSDSANALRIIPPPDMRIYPTTASSQPVRNAVETSIAYDRPFFYEKSGNYGSKTVKSDLEGKSSVESVVYGRPYDYDKSLSFGSKTSKSKPENIDEVMAMTSSQSWQPIIPQMLPTEWDKSTGTSEDSWQNGKVMPISENYINSTYFNRSHSLSGQDNYNNYNNYGDYNNYHNYSDVSQKIATRLINNFKSAFFKNPKEMNGSQSQVKFVEITNTGRPELRDERLSAEKLRAERSKVEQSRAERSKAEELRIERLKAEQLRAERSKAEESRIERLKAEQSRAERSKADQIRAQQIRAGKQRAEEFRAAQLEEAKLLDLLKQENPPKITKEERNSPEVTTPKLINDNDYDDDSYEDYSSEEYYDDEKDNSVTKPPISTTTTRSTLKILKTPNPTKSTPNNSTSSNFNRTTLATQSTILSRSLLNRLSSTTPKITLASTTKSRNNTISTVKTTLSKFAKSRLTTTTPKYKKTTVTTTTVKPILKKSWRDRLSTTTVKSVPEKTTSSLRSLRSSKRFFERTNSTDS